MSTRIDSPVVPPRAPAETPPQAARPFWLWRLGLWVLGLAITRIILGMVAVVGVTSGVQWLIKDLRWMPDTPGSPLVVAQHVLGAVLVIGAALGAYSLFVRFTEHRWPGELRVRSLPTELGAGLFLGVALSSTVVGVLATLGVYHVDSVAATSQWPQLLARAAISALAVGAIEELIARAIIFRITQQRLGSLWAIAISSLLFGLAHVGNPNATLAGALGLALQAGVLLGAAYILTQRLWFAIGLHCAWNFMQQAVFGGALSGNSVRTILNSHPSGPAWLSGGEFGIEGSIVATIICGGVGVVLLVIASRRARLVQRTWPDRSEQTPVPAAV